MWTYNSLSLLLPHLAIINACVANGGWVLTDLGTDPNNPNPGRWDTPISLPYPQPSHEPRPPPQTPNQAPVTLNITFKGETIEEKPLPPQIGRGGREKTRKHTNATTPNAEPSQSHKAMRRRMSNTQRSRWPLELPRKRPGQAPHSPIKHPRYKTLQAPPAKNPNANATPRHATLRHAMPCLTNCATCSWSLTKLNCI